MAGQLAVLVGAAVMTALAPTHKADIEAGQALAQRWCSNCHTVETDARSAKDAAPSFRAIARKKSTTSGTLHGFLQLPHANMPDWTLTRDEIDDLVAYILSLKWLAGAGAPGGDQASAATVAGADRNNPDHAFCSEIFLSRKSRNTAMRMEWRSSSG
jgi:mono/diheme cytochrome c family protein